MDSNFEVNLGVNEIELELPGGARGLKGDKGDIGEPGPANTLSIGTVTSGDTADASITGESPNQTLNLTLPKGDKGDTGPQGPPGTTDHSLLTNKDLANQHPISAISGLQEALNQAGRVDDVKINNASVVSNKVANIELKTINNQSITGTGDIALPVQIYKGSTEPQEQNILVWIDTSGDTPILGTQLITFDNNKFITSDNKNFILKEEN